MYKKNNTGRYIVIGLIMLVVAIASAGGCSEQEPVKNWSGNMEVTLKPNNKLVEVTWNDNSLWYLTKEMTDDFRS